MTILSDLRSGRELHIAHRGASASFPENTMPAFYAAERSGAHCIELDVHLTADDVVVILHDDTLNRTTTGTGRVDEFTWKDLQDLDAGVWKGPQCAGTRLPLLSDALEWLPNHLCLNIELKGLPHTANRLTECVLDEVTRDLAAQLRLATIHPHWSSVDKEWVAQAHKQQLHVLAWTIKTAEQVHHCRASGVQGLIVDDLELVKSPLTSAV